VNSPNYSTFNEKEEKIVDILAGLGIKKNVAKVVVYLSVVSEATSRVIERVTDLRQPEVSIAMRYLKENNWVEIQEKKKESKGRPVKIYRLSKPINEITDKIEGEMKLQTQNKLELLQALRDIILK